jgi:hypothetical protein
MTPDDSMLPPGTSMILSRSCLHLGIDWEGLSGRHIICLKATLEDEEDDRAQAIANAVELFRNMVGLEVIGDAVGAGEWPMGHPDEPSDSTDPWCRTRE